MSWRLINFCGIEGITFNKIENSRIAFNTIKTIFLPIIEYYSMVF